MSSKRNVVRAVVAAGLTVALTSGIALASIGTGTVTASALRLRSQATTQSATLAYATRNAQVTVLSAVSEGWYQVTYDGVVGYMSADWLDVDLSDSESGDSPSDGAQEARQGVVTDGPLNVRSGPGTSYEVQASTQNGAVVTVLEEAGDGWYHIRYATGGGNYEEGYVLGDYLTAR